ncbi:GNAT family N-acetyltransferase [Microvirga sp. BSC39]|uniref:GNAT family N-acetyltransferase n=1 Tax=Microvirga sp. BSC39 TaxID=1549810 RepID=UPI000567A3FD|nr:GNAT family N-acetyltransferase [Microvirga sp. BSC39]
MIFDTESLHLRPPCSSDALLLFRFLGDAQAMRFTQAHPSLDHTDRYLEAHELNRQRVGYAPWTILEKSSRTIVGFGGLYEDPFDPGWGLEVGYYFAPSAWGKGYATELVRFSLALLRQDRALSVVRAFAHPENTASRRVLLKAGFTEERFIPFMNRHLYRADLSGSP